MKNNIILYSLLLLIGIFQACDLLDPTEADPNPNLTKDAITATGSATKPWLNGLERQLAIVSQEYIVPMEILSDNYINTSTFYNTNFDDLFVQYADDDIDDFLFAVSDLRESAITGLTVIAPSDQSTSDNDLAEMHYFLGLSYLLLGEYFAMPVIEPDGLPVNYEISIDSAIVNFNRALGLGVSASSDVRASYYLALSRSHYHLKDQTEAVIAANETIALSPSLTRYIDFDNTNEPQNTVSDAIYDRTNFDLQPLPRLDFLDPKFHTIGITELGIPYVKAEEAHLILAEAAIADGDLAGAQDIMNDILTLVGTRPVDIVPEQDQRRNNSGTGIKRPNGAAIDVRASSLDPFRSGLVLTRPDSIPSGTPDPIDIMVPIVSGTSVTSADIAALATEDEALELLYLLRQEIFIAEGRRVVDLGIKLPISQNEQLQNPNIAEGDISTNPILPDFVPANSDMDAYTWNRASNQVTIEVNMNRVLVENKASDLVLPFH